MAKKYSRVEAVDFTGVFSPVVRYLTIRLLFPVTAHHNLPWKQTDIKNVFRNANVTEERYVQQPEGFVLRDSHHYAYLLNKAQYGSKQASKKWHDHLDIFLADIGYETSDADQSLYVLREDERFAILVLYVDEINLMGEDDDIISDVISRFKAKFGIRTSEGTDLFLGMTIENFDEKIKFHNGPIMERLLASYGMGQCKQNAMPLSAGLDFTTGDKTQLSLSTTYRRLIGSLMPLSNTVCPDITFAVQYLARFMHSPTAGFWKAGKHLLRYLRETDEL